MAGTLLVYTVRPATDTPVSGGVGRGKAYSYLHILRAYQQREAR